jgi:hypothetical protein
MEKYEIVKTGWVGNKFYTKGQIAEIEIVPKICEEYVNKIEPKFSKAGRKNKIIQIIEDNEVEVANG